MALRIALCIVLATNAARVLASCGYGTVLQPRPEDGHVEVDSFGYAGSTGPANWAALNPATNALCATGRNQSPIDVLAGSLSMVPVAEFGLSIPDMPTGTKFENLGTTVEVIAESGSMVFRGVNYTLRQFHFHLPSEHLDNGTSMAMEMHMVWEGQADEIAVIGIFIDIDNGSVPVAAPDTTPSALLEAVLSSVEDIVAPGSVTKTQPLIMSELVNTLLSGSFYTYKGSLTTPPCSEGVQWLLSDQKLSVQAPIFSKVRSVLGFNARFPQNIPGEENVLSIACAEA